MRKAIVLGLTLVVASSCVAQTVGPVPSTYRTPPPVDSSAELAKLMQAREGSLVFQPYDLLKLNVAGADEVSERVRVAPDGTIGVPLAGSLPVAGMTASEAQDAVAQLLRDKQLVRDPAVTIDVLETPGRVVTIAGQVRSPGVYPLIGDSQIGTTNPTALGGVQTLGQLLALAGGLLDSSSDVITLTRASLATPVSIPMGNDPNHMPYAGLQLAAGDQIEVPRGGLAYVIGAVKKQGAISLKNFSPTTVSQAMALVEGIGYEAAENDARLVRTEGDHRVVYKVEIRKIIEGKVADVALQNDDILYVPTVAGKAALKGGAAGLIVSLAATYIYAHP